MERYTYNINGDHDSRSEFINKVIKMACKGREWAFFNEFIFELMDEFQHFVRNSYELADNEIPAFGWVEISRIAEKENMPQEFESELEDFMMTKDEFCAAKKRVTKACFEFYVITD